MELWGSELVRYGMVGAFNTAFGYLLFAGLYFALGHRVQYLVLLVVAFFASTVVAFLLHRKITFRYTGPSRIAAVKFIVINSATLLANGVLLSLFVEILHLHVLVGQFLAVSVVAFSGYVAHRRISFARQS